jgi:hypothetical protein
MDEFICAACDTRTEEREREREREREEREIRYLLHDHGLGAGLRELYVLIPLPAM